MTTRWADIGWSGAPGAPSTGWLGRRLRALRTSSSIAVLGLGPTLVWAALLWIEGQQGVVAEDFRRQVLPAAHAVLHGDSPYPEVSELVASSAAYVYPPPTALVSLPLASLPDSTAAWVVTAVMLGLVPLTLRLLGVRDWRCYGAALLWAPVASAVQTGNMSLPLAVCTALAWRGRSRRPWAAVGVGTALKLFTWPLVVWLIATGRRLQAVFAVVGAAAVVLGAWAAIGFAGIGEYVSLTNRLEELQAPRAYTLYALGLELGLSTALAKAAWLGVGLASLVCCATFGRRRDDRRSFAMGVIACVALSPIVWLHYLALLLVPLAITRPRFSAVWLLPLVLWVVPADGNGREPWQTALLLGVMTAVGWLSLGRKTSAALPRPSVGVTEA